jgi:signal transduction histidine kinase
MTIKIEGRLTERLADLHKVCLELIQESSLESLLDRIATLTCDLTGAGFSAVGVIEETGKISHFIQAGDPPEPIKNLLADSQQSEKFADSLRSGTVIRLADLERDPRLTEFQPVIQSLHSFVCIPIRQVDKIFGQIYLVDKLDGQPFDDEDETVLVTLAGYAASTISRQRVIREYRKRDETLKRQNMDLVLVDELATGLTCSMDMDEILERAITSVMEYTNIRESQIFLSEEDGKTLRMMKYRGEIKSSIWIRDQYIIGASFVGVAAESGNPYIGDVTGKVRKELKKSALNANLNQIACFPLNGRVDPVGVLCLATADGKTLNERDIQLFTTIGKWIGAAVENVRYYYLGRRQAVMDERDRIGMDLHDSIIQSIYGVGLTLDHARLLMTEDPELASRRLEHAMDDLNSTIRDIRSYILDLRPRQLHDQDLMEGLQRLVAEFRANTLVEATLEGLQKKPISLPQQNALALFHICQESLANIAKHAHAHKVNVTVWGTSRRMLLEIKDDGVGFDVSMTNKNLGHGLANIYTRARNAGGDVEITSIIGEGTTILAWVPYKNGRQ